MTLETMKLLRFWFWFYIFKKSMHFIIIIYNGELNLSVYLQ